MKAFENIGHRIAIAALKMGFGLSTQAALNIKEDVILNQSVFHIATGYHPSRRTPGCNAGKKRRRAAQVRGGRS